MKFGSLFAGVGGFDLGLERAGMTPAWQVEIDPACREVLAHHWPGVTRHTDVKEVGHPTLTPVDVIVGGFPCQDISVAGRRAGLAGERSGLWWEFHRIIYELDPTWVVIENVPGLLSSNDGGDMGAVLGALGDLGYGFAYRVLDAQFFGVAQRRRRVFVVGCRGDERSARAVLLEPEGGAGDPPPRREAGPRVALAPVVSTLQGGGKRGYRVDAESAAGGQLSPVVSRALKAAVRRLTPTECERLQGFPDGWTDVAHAKPLKKQLDRTVPMPDSIRYRMLGNAVCVNVAAWIARRLVAVEHGLELETAA